MYKHHVEKKVGILARIICLVLLLAALSVLSACVRPSPPIGTTYELAESAWSEFQTRATETERGQQTFRIAASLKLVDKNGSRLLQSLLWGNALNNPGCLVRLDLRAGIGVVLAKLCESRDQLLVFLPEENRAAHTNNPNLNQLGLPIPFSLIELSELLIGREAKVLAPGITETPPLAQKALIGKDNASGITYQLTSGHFKGRLLLSPEGNPLAWESNVTSGPYSGWNMLFVYSDQWGDGTGDDGVKLKRLELNFPQTQRQLVLNIKERATPEPYSPAQLTFELPGNVRPAHLDSNWLRNQQN